jgi:hypothetical protein
MQTDAEQTGRRFGLPLKEALFLGFCAVFILFTRAALRLHLGISGHAMFFSLFFLMLARASVNYRLAATFVGFLAGAMAVVLGLGKGGPLIMLKFLLPALVVDLGAALLPAVFQSYLLSGLLAACAAATKFIDTYVVDTLVGMDDAVVLQHAALKALGGVAFGVAGSLLIPPVVRKLRAYGAIGETSGAANDAPG